MGGFAITQKNNNRFLLSLIGLIIVIIGWVIFYYFFDQRLIDRTSLPWTPWISLGGIGGSLLIIWVLNYYNLKMTHVDYVKTYLEARSMFRYSIAGLAGFTTIYLTFYQLNKTGIGFLRLQFVLLILPWLYFNYLYFFNVLAPIRNDYFSSYEK